MLNKNKDKVNQRYLPNEKQAKGKFHDFPTYEKAQPETSPQNNIQIVESNVQSQWNTIQIVENNLTKVPVEPEPESGTGMPRALGNAADPEIQVDLQADIDVTIEPEFTVEP